MQPPAKGQIHKHYSINYSWGFNNRTCAIRIPQSTFIAPSNTRIEHRVCSPVANMNLAIASILYSLSFGITNNLTAAQPIYGDAFDPQYMHLKRFPIFLQEALLQKSIKDIMQNSL
jgi:glutamine synthetase